MLTRHLDTGVDRSGASLAAVIYGANDGIVTTFAVVARVAGWTPLLPDLRSLEPLFELSVAATAVGFVAVGASRTVLTERDWLRSGLEMLGIGLGAAVAAFAGGAVLSGVA